MPGIICSTLHLCSSFGDFNVKDDNIEFQEYFFFSLLDSIPILSPSLSSSLALTSLMEEIFVTRFFLILFYLVAFSMARLLGYCVYTNSVNRLSQNLEEEEVAYHLHMGFCIPIDSRYMVSLEVHELYKWMKTDTDTSKSHAYNIYGYS